VPQVVCAHAGFEARGLVFGAPLALTLKCAFVPLRKPGKLPGETVRESYTLEYGSDTIEMHVGAVREGQRVLLIDDLIATGGTMGAGIRLIRARPDWWLRLVAWLCSALARQALRGTWPTSLCACVLLQARMWWHLGGWGAEDIHVACSQLRVCLADKVKAEVVECACVIELPDLKGRDKLEGHPLYVLIEKEGL
jgi:adenine/guanine phosphoribosyltransferase-like PRPP-binding protein